MTETLRPCDCGAPPRLYRIGQQSLLPWQSNEAFFVQCSICEKRTKGYELPDMAILALEPARTVEQEKEEAVSAGFPEGGVLPFPARLVILQTRGAAKVLIHLPPVGQPPDVSSRNCLSNEARWELQFPRAILIYAWRESKQQQEPTRCPKGHPAGIAS